MNPLRAFSEHPATVGESYIGHLLQATGFGLRMILAGLACVLHGLFPFLCVTTGSDAMTALHREMAARRARACGSAGDASAAPVGQADPVRTPAAIR